MQCRCEEIRRVDRDISKLDNMRSNTDRMSGTSSRQNTTLRNLSGIATRLATPGNNSSLSMQTSRLNTVISSNIETVSNRISNEIISFRNTRPTLNEEDIRFHRAQSINSTAVRSNTTSSRTTTPTNTATQPRVITTTSNTSQFRR
jgi:hypothetical protein